MRALLATLLLAACQGHAETNQSIHWDDGDSGKIGEVRFRLADVDAPETRSEDSPVGPAQCKEEISAGFEAKRFMIELTKRGPLSFKWNGETDRHRRKVGDLLVDGRSVSVAGLEAGHLRPWEHEGSRQLMPKPDWCE